MSRLLQIGSLKKQALKNNISNDTSNNIDNNSNLAGEFINFSIRIYKLLKTH